MAEKPISFCGKSKPHLNDGNPSKLSHIYHLMYLVYISSPEKSTSRPKRRIFKEVENGPLLVHAHTCLIQRATYFKSDALQRNHSHLGNDPFQQRYKVAQTHAPSPSLPVATGHWVVKRNRAVAPSCENHRLYYVLHNVKTD